MPCEARRIPMSLPIPTFKPSFFRAADHASVCNCSRMRLRTTTTGRATRRALSWCPIAAGPACTITHANRPIPTIATIRLLFFIWHCRRRCWISNVTRVSSSLEAKNELSSESARRPVKEVAKTITVQIVLHVARIEVIEQVEYPQPDLHRFLFTPEAHSEFLEQLSIE